MPQRKKDAFTSVGKRIRSARTKKKMTLDQVANETGCSVEYLKEVEEGQEMPPVGTLLQIARALAIDSGDLLQGKTTGKQNRSSAFTQRTENYAYTTLTPGAENKHLKGFRVIIPPMREHKGVGYQHEGEEFIYLLAGSIEVTVGDHANMLKIGDALHFNSGIPHRIKNLGSDKAEMLVVVYAP